MTLFWLFCFPFNVVNILEKMDYYDSRSTSGVLYTVLERCIEDVLSFIKPLESDRNKRLKTIDEIVRSVQSIGTLKGRQQSM